MPIAFQTGTTWTFQRFVVYSCPVSVAGTSRKNVTKTSRPKRQRIVLQIQGQKQRHNVQSQDQRQRSPYRYFGAKTTADNASHFMTHDPRDQSLARDPRDP